MQEVSFSIRQVEHGWLVFQIGDVNVWASNVWGHDGASQLLKLVRLCVEGTVEEGAAVFDDEPGTFILRIQRDASTRLELWLCPLSHHEWYPDMAEPEVLSSLPKRVKLDNCLLRVDDVDLWTFACALADAFSALLLPDMREQYEQHWMPFPSEELTALRHALGDYSQDALIP